MMVNPIKYLKIKINKVLAKKHKKEIRSRLKNSGMTVIASNCNGGCILNDLGQQFNSPFVNLWLEPSDFLRYLKNMEYYN